MYEVMCYGDSNTWGYSPESKERFPRDARWTGVLQRSLGPGFVVIEEGQNGRTTVWDDPVEQHKNGLDYLLPCLESHHPLDLVVLMLGTNDLKIRYSVSPMDIGWSIRNLVTAIQKSEFGPDGRAPLVLLMAPPPLAKLSDFAELFEGGTEKSRRLAKRYAEIAAERGCAYLDAGSIIRTSDLDGVHFEAAEHRKLGEAVAREVKRLLPA